MACISCGPACDCDLILKHFLFPSVILPHLFPVLGFGGKEVMSPDLISSEIRFMLAELRYRTPPNSLSVLLC